MRVPKNKNAEWLPCVTCVGVFRSDELDYDKGVGIEESFLRIIWYQEKYTPTINEITLDKIRSLDWAKQAVEIF